MSRNITAIRLSAGGTRHEHITAVRWQVAGTYQTGDSTTADMVHWIEAGGSAYVSNGHRTVSVGVVEPNIGAKYLRTHADGVWTDNLLALPRF
ncbi:DUF3892 domain-containing protein [Actinocatenispora sera]|nr:DUF3892 domain-containing protein [Actinocatenispora sera]